MQEVKELLAETPRGFRYSEDAQQEVEEIMTDLVNMMGSWTIPDSEREHQPMFNADHDIINSNRLSVMQREANEIVKAWVSIEDDNEVQAEEALMVLEPDDEDEVPVVVESGPADADVVMVGEEVAKPSLDTVVTHLAAVQSHLLGIEEALAELGARGVNEHFADTQNSAL